MERTYTVTTKSVEDLLKEGYEITWGDRGGMWKVNEKFYFPEDLGQVFHGCSKKGVGYKKGLMDLIHVKHVEPELIKGDIVKAWDEDDNGWWRVGIYLCTENGKHRIKLSPNAAEVYEHVAFLEPNDYL